ncbi:MAG: hypothetical protein R6U85_10040 [Salinivirgaceae bacterium]
MINSKTFKQWGGTNKKKNGRLLDGKEYNETSMVKGFNHIHE